MSLNNIRYVGVNDHEIDLFEGQYPVPNGMAYNSYAVIDEKIAVMDSVEARFAGEWLDNIRSVLEGRVPDYLVVQHMEPDHSSSILQFLQAYPRAQIVASERAFGMIRNFYGADLSDRKVVVGDGDTLSLGGRTLTFATAAMVHWPEVIVTYDDKEKVLFAADAFGKFGALDAEEDWTDEARRYYIGIVGKYGIPVQALLKKAAALDIRAICPLHGPVLTEHLDYYIGLYDTWSRYEAEEDGILIAYTSIYGNTKRAVEQLAEMLRETSGGPVAVYDLARCDMFQAVAEAFRYRKLVLATTTYNGGIFPFMRTFIHHLTERGFSNRTVAFIENGSWAPAAVRTMKGLLEKSKGLTYVEPAVKILSALNEESSAQLAALAQELCRASDVEPAAPKAEGAPTKKFVCKICGYVYEGEALPEGFTCPLCKRGAEDFEELK